MPSEQVLTELAADRAAVQARERAARRRARAAASPYRRVWVAALAAGQRTVSGTLAGEAAREWARSRRASQAAIETAMAQGAARGELSALRLLEAAGLGRGEGQVGREVVAELTAEGSRLSRLLDRRFADSGVGGPEQVGRLLESGFADGLSPQEVTRQVLREVDAGVRSTERIARTEMMRAHRETNRSVFQERDGVTGWRWVVDESARTCAVCWGLYGEVYTTSAEFPAHPNCRCRMVPVLDDPEADRLVAPDDKNTAFARLSPEEQRQVLGPGGYDKWQAGTGLDEFATVTRDPVWGPTAVRVPNSRL